MNENIWKFLEPLIIDHLGELLVDNEEYKRLIDKETLCYEELKKNLEKEQKEKLEQYFNSTNETSIFCQEFAYKRGMTDLLMFIEGLMFK